MRACREREVIKKYGKGTTILLCLAGKDYRYTATTVVPFHAGITTNAKSLASTKLCTYVTEFRAVRPKAMNLRNGLWEQCHVMCDDFR
jgi:hypothetical protein